MRISNKQHLFDKRIENYLLARGLIELYLANRRWFNAERKDAPQLTIDFEFGKMTNNSYLNDVVGVMSRPLENPEQKEFLTKLEEMKILASKAKFLFCGKSADFLSEFIADYQKLLNEMYKYRITVVHMTDEIYRPLSLRKMEWTLEESSKSIGEPKQRKELYECMDKLVKSYRAIEKNNVLAKLEKQIKLKGVI